MEIETVYQEMIMMQMATEMASMEMEIKLKVTRIWQKDKETILKDQRTW